MTSPSPTPMLTSGTRLHLHVATPDSSPDVDDAAQEDIKPEIQVDLPDSVYI